VTALLGFLAMSALIAWLVRQPSAELLEEADRHYRAADRWASMSTETGADRFWCICRRDLHIRDGHALTRKALRRMPWRLI
jgi:hypothetical protein